MTISRKCVVVALSLLVAAGLAAGQAVVVDAQIINASLPTSSEGVQTAAGNATTGEAQGGFLPVSWPSVSLPRVTMPQFTMPQIPMPQIPMPKWPTHADGTAVSPFAPITAGASKISAGTQKAWQGAKEMFGFGSSFDSDGRAAQLAASPSEPSFWQRMTGREPEPAGPRTVAEFMAQPRVGQ